MTYMYCSCRAERSHDTYRKSKRTRLLQAR